MPQTVDRQNLEEIIASLSRRMDRMETGGKPMVGLSDQGSANFTLAAGAMITGLAANLEWVDTNVVVNPNAIPYIALFVDNDANTAYLWPSGVSLSSGQKNIDFNWFFDLNDLNNTPNRSQARFMIRNNDSISHNFYFYIKWAYITGSNGGQ